MRPLDLLLTSSQLRALGVTAPSLRRAVSRGSLVRLRRGRYCLGDVWRGLDEREQHVVRAAAVVADTRDPLLAFESAAAVWGIPLSSWPSDVVVLTEHTAGGKSEPGVRRTAVGARGAPRGLRDGLPVADLPRTVVDVAASLGFPTGVLAADWALRRGVSRDRLEDALRARSSRYGASVAAEAIAFADPAAENGGESFARGLIHLLGFVTPELQCVVRDSLGEMRVDFRWRRSDGSVLYGEFDGKVKYMREEYTHGDPAEVLWQEKKREDRLRVTGGVVRILWEHLVDPARLTRLLSDAGVPRRADAVRGSRVEFAPVR